ncbi:MAG: helix-turn-helix transcriptional regulator [Lachnospiraceae bacterium]|nr:helix-turn-helix transcriptional regulator [Lachnospiraceae bacterium]
MSFGTNLQILRKIGNDMTQEELAERLCVSRQTISKWELDIAYPEINKLIELCDLFSCTMDELVRGDLNMNSNIYSDIKIKVIEPFHYIKYAVISTEPEDDAVNHVNLWAEKLNITNPEIIGWDFPFLSQEQINVMHMHGYEAALILNDETLINSTEEQVFIQERQKYIFITISEPFVSPFCSIPNAYKILMKHMKINGLKHKQDKNIIEFFEKSYKIKERHYMDVYIAIK